MIEEYNDSVIESVPGECNSQFTTEYEKCDDLGEKAYSWLNN